MRLQVADAGDPAAPPIIAVHGWPQHWWMWRGVIPAFAAAYRVICSHLRTVRGASGRRKVRKRIVLHTTLIRNGKRISFR